MMESADAIDDSDDEVDYTKMDQGNKKGPVGRWDFDTQEEYSDYMSNKEALPKYVPFHFVSIKICSVSFLCCYSVVLFFKTAVRTISISFNIQHVLDIMNRSSKSQ